jgi:predicted nucleic acid-binding protein
MRPWALSIVIAGTLVTGRAVAQAETEEDRRIARRLFVEGQHAFTTGDYRHAAESFEGAYQKLPKLPALWNAARAWHRAGEPVKAANLYAEYLDKAPPKAPDRAAAIKSMKELEAKLGRLEIHAEGFDSVTVDGQPLAGTRLYVTPGSHLVEARAGAKVARETPTAVAGTATSVVLVVPPDPAPLPPPTVVEAPPPKSHGLSPVFVGVGAGLTALGAGLVIWSGLETLGQRSTFDKVPTQQNLDAGRSMETRTNVLLGVTIGLAVVTGITAIFTDWGSKKKEQSARVVVGPGSLGVEGAF